MYTKTMFKRPNTNFLSFDKHCCCCYQSLTCVQLFAITWTVACQAPLSMGFPRQGYWSGLPFPFPGDLSNPGIKPRSPSLQADSLPAEAQRKYLIHLTWMIFTIIYLVLQVTVYISYFTLLGCKFLEGRNDFLSIFEYLSTTLLSNSTELSHSILCDGYFF